MVEPRLNRLTRDGEAIQIELKMMVVLVCLAEHAGDLVERKQLIDTVWATEYISENILTRAIAELRNVLGDDAKNSRYIETIHRRGYRLIAPVTCLGEEDSSDPPVPNIVVEDATSDDEPSKLDRDGALRWPHVLAVAIAVSIGLLVVLPPEGLIDRLTGSIADSSIHSIAVLPLVNFSGDPDNEYFADGMTDALITELAKIGGFEKVISRTSMMQLKGSELSLPQIADVLGVDGILEGSVQPVDQRIRVEVRLIHAASAGQVWSGRYDREFSQILDLQSEVARTVAREVRVTLTPSEEERPQTGQRVVKEAYEAYLMGIHFSHEGGTYENYSRSVKYYRRAIEIDPFFARHVYAALLSYLGRFDESLSLIDRGLELDPLSRGLLDRRGLVLFLARRYDDSIDTYLNAIALYPSRPKFHYRLANSFAANGQPDKALTAIEKARELHSNPAEDPFMLLYEVIVFARIGEDEKADEALSQLLELKETRGVAPGVLAFAYTALGDAESAIGWLETAYNEHDTQISVLRRLPAWRKLELLGDACDTTRALMMAGLRSRFSGHSEAELHRKLMSLLVGDEIADRIWGPER